MTSAVLLSGSGSITDRLLNEVTLFDLVMVGTPPERILAKSHFKMSFKPTWKLHFLKVLHFPKTSDSCIHVVGP
jgi:hypothetical protein